MSAWAPSFINGAGSLNNGAQSEFISTEARMIASSHLWQVCDGWDWSPADRFFEQSWEELNDEVYKASSLFFSISFTHKYIHPHVAGTCTHEAMVNRVIEEITQAGVGLALHHRMQRLGWCQSIAYQRIFLILFIKKKCLLLARIGNSSLPSVFSWIQSLKLRQNFITCHGYWSEVLRISTVACDGRLVCGKCTQSCDKTATTSCVTL